VLDLVLDEVSKWGHDKSKSMAGEAGNYMNCVGINARLAKTLFLWLVAKTYSRIFALDTIINRHCKEDTQEHVIVLQE
jgi:hypothetical protein